MDRSRHLLRTLWVSDHRDFTQDPCQQRLLVSFLYSTSGSHPSTFTLVAAFLLSRRETSSTHNSWVHSVCRELHGFYAVREIRAWLVMVASRRGALLPALAPHRSAVRSPEATHRPRRAFGSRASHSGT